MSAVSTTTKNTSAGSGKSNRSFITFYAFLAALGIQNNDRNLVCAPNCEKERGNNCRDRRLVSLDMADPSDANRSPLLGDLLQLASIDYSITDSHSIRSWLASAKKCFDQVSSSPLECCELIIIRPRRTTLAMISKLLL